MLTTNEEYILQHRNDDVRQLALKKGPEGVDVPWCLQQIEGWQLARKKLPRWASAEGLLWFPPRLSMEQCSSELTALYKQQLVERLLPREQRGSMADLTGGFGIDFSYIAPLFAHSTYVERQSVLCDIARHNLPLLGLPEAEVVEGDCVQQMSHTGSALPLQTDLLFMDPARRDTAGRKTVALEDCTPNVVEMQTLLLSRARFLILKLSPMLDISLALRALRGVVEVHVVSVKGECKELLLVLRGEQGGAESACVEGTVASCEQNPEGITYHCVNLDASDAPLCCTQAERSVAPVIMQAEALSPSCYLFEPNASVLKVGCQDLLCQRYGVAKLHPCSNLFVGPHPVDGFPGRQFSIVAVSDFGKKGLKRLLADVQQANLTTRNFPTSVADLRKKLKLREGGDTYLFATTLSDGSHALIRCVK